MLATFRENDFFDYDVLRVHAFAQQGGCSGQMCRGTQRKRGFDTFMDFVKGQGVERSANESFKVEQVAGKWGDLPKSVRSYEPGGYGSIVDDIGDHIQNQRLPGGYHLSVDVVNGPVNLHFDAYDPLRGPVQNYLHWYREVRQINNGNLSVPAPSNNHAGWGQ